MGAAGAGEAGALGGAEAFPVTGGAAIPATELGAAGTAAGGLTGAQALQYAKMGLSGLGLASQLAGLGGGQGSGSGGQGGSGGNPLSTQTVVNPNGPWNNNGNPLSATNLTWTPHEQKPITAGDENVKTLFSSLDPNLYSQLARSGMLPSGVGGSSYFTYGSPAQTTQPTTAQDPLAYQMPQFAAGGGVLDMYSQGGDTHVPEFITGATGHYVKGRGDGQADLVPAMLASGEYVWDADTVASLGNGDSDSGAKVLDGMRKAIRAHKRSAPIDEIPPKAKSPLQYMKDAEKYIQREK